MDQMAVSLGREREALFLDTRTLEHEALPLPPAAELIVIDSGVAHQHAGGGYVVRRQESFAAAIRNFAPDVVLSDHSLGQFNSFAAQSIVRELRPTAPFIIVTGAITGAQSVAAIRAGAEDLVLKASVSRLAASITEALAVRRPLHKLTERQVQVLTMVAEGHRTRDIARQLSLSVKTVESHRGEIMKRLKMHDVVSLVRYAMRVGLVSAAPDTRN